MNTKLIIVALGVFLFATSFLVSGVAFDSQLYDTYYVIGWSNAFQVVGLLCFLVGGISFLLNRKSLSKQ